MSQSGPLSGSGGGGSGGGFKWEQISSNTLAVNGFGYQVTANSPTITLPAGSVGNAVAVMLSGGTAFVVRTPGAGVITIANTNSSSNPASIQSGAMSTGATVTLICTTAGSGWQALSSEGNFLFTVI